MDGEPNYITSAKRQRMHEQRDLESLVGDQLDAMPDDELRAILEKHNTFAVRRMDSVGRAAMPRLTLLRAVFSS